MNWMIRFGNWMEERRSVPRPEFVRLVERVDKHIEVQEAQASVPDPLAKEILLLKQRLNVLEIYVGFRREKPVAVPGASQIS